MATKNPKKLSKTIEKIKRKNLEDYNKIFSYSSQIEINRNKLPHMMRSEEYHNREKLKSEEMNIDYQDNQLFKDE
jgi:hypothetical protein